MATGYTRQSSGSIITGATILASHFNNEYNQLNSAFDNTTGHRHDASVTGGGASLVIASFTGLNNTTSGILGADGANGFTARTITGTAGTITVTNGTGVSGNPTLTIDATYVGQSSITTLGTIGTGTWHGSVITGTYGGTGVNNGSNTVTLGGNLTTSGAFNTTLTTTGTTTVTLPTSGTLCTTIGSSSIVTVGTITSGTWNATVVSPIYGGTGVANLAANTLTYSGNFGLTLTLTNTTSLTLPTSGTLCTTLGSSSIATVGTITAGVWNGTVITGTYGGTGVNNGSSLLTYGGNVTFSGAFTTTLTVTGNTSVTLPTSGTLINSAVATLSSLTSAASLATIGTVTTGTWNATKIGTVYGGTNTDSSASSGVAQVNAGTWSYSTALANLTTATTQSAGDASTKVATTAYTDTAVTNGKLMTALGVGSIIIATNNTGGTVTAGSTTAAANIIIEQFGNGGSIHGASDTIAGTWRALQTLEANSTVAGTGLWQRTA